MHLHQIPSRVELVSIKPVECRVANFVSLDISKSDPKVLEFRIHETGQYRILVFAHGHAPFISEVFSILSKNPITRRREGRKGLVNVGQRTALVKRTSAPLSDADCTFDERDGDGQGKRAKTAQSASGASSVTSAASSTSSLCGGQLTPRSEKDDV